jgi:hypothetical protein
MSRDSSSTTSPLPRVRVPRHVAWLITRLVVDYFDYAACPGASARRTAHHVARCRLLRLRRASGCLGMSRSSSSTTSPLPRRVPRHVARLVTQLVVDYFAYAARLGASACRVARRRLLRLAQARHQLLRLRRASGCLGTSHGSPRGSSSTTSPPPRVRVPRHVARLVTQLVVDLLRLRRASRCLGSSRRSSSTTSPASRVRMPRHVAQHVARLVVDYYTYAARPGASARHAARRRLLRLRRASGCPGTSRGSSSTTLSTLSVRVPRHVAWLVTRLVIEYFDYAARPGASARCAARHTARRAVRRQLRLRRVSGCLGTSRGLLSTSSPTPRVRVPRHVARLVTRLVPDYSVRRDFVLRPH